MAFSLPSKKWNLTGVCLGLLRCKCQDRVKCAQHLLKETTVKAKEDGATEGGDFRPWHMSNTCERQWARNRFGCKGSQMAVQVWEGSSQASEEPLSQHCLLKGSPSCRNGSALVPLPCLFVRESSLWQAGPQGQWSGGYKEGSNTPCSRTEHCVFMATANTRKGCHSKKGMKSISNQTSF